MEDRLPESESSGVNEPSSLAGRVFIYLLIAVTICLLTVAGLLYLRGEFRFNLGLGSIESILDTFLVALASLLLLLVVIRVAAPRFINQGSDEVGEKERVVAPRELPFELGEKNLIIFDETIEVPDGLRPIIAHVIESHGHEMLSKAQRMKIDSGGDDLEGVNLVLAFLELVEKHIDDSRLTLSGAVTRTIGSMASRWREERSSSE